MARSASKKRPEGREFKPAFNGLQRWNQLTAIRSGMMSRFEQYASVTIPKVCLPEGVTQNTASIQHDWSSVGAQAVNHLTNKLVIALFQPGMPFFRLDPDEKLRKQMEAAGVAEDVLRDALVGGEQRALQVMDQKAVRPKVHEAIRNLVVVGNVLLDLFDEDNPRAIGIKNYAVKRSISGKVQEIVHYEKVLYDELDDAAKEVVPPKYGEDSYVEYVRWFTKRHTKWNVNISVDGQDLGEQFSQTWNEDNFHLYPVVWDLADNHDYGTGLVEDYAGDFGTLSTLSEAEIKAAVLASDFRWLANPAGVGDIEEFKRSRTGDVIPGVTSDLALVAHVGTGALQSIGMSVERVIQRIGRGFLLGTAVTRQAERVTAEEIRMQANELETSLGGVYSRLAVDMQLPISRWLLRQIGVSIEGTTLIPTIITGLAALSRNAEAQQLGSFLSALAGVGTLPPDVLARLKLSPVISTLASAYGITASQYVKSEEEVAQEQQQAQAQQQEMMAQQEAAKAGAANLTKDTDE